MEEAMRGELQKGLEDIIQKFGKRYSIRNDNDCIKIHKKPFFLRKRPGSVIFNIRVEGNRILAEEYSSDMRLSEVSDYLDDFSKKYASKGVVLKYEDFKIMMPPPPYNPLYPYDNI